MRNYFENLNPEWMSIVPFDKVVVIRSITDKSILVFDVNSEQHGTEFPIEQLQDYKDWLALKQQALEDSVSQVVTARFDTEFDKEKAKKMIEMCKDGQVLPLKPEITEDMLIFLQKETGKLFCRMCSYKDSSLCYDCDGIINLEFGVYPLTLHSLNKKWQYSE